MYVAAGLKAIETGAQRTEQKDHAILAWSKHDKSEDVQPADLKGFTCDGLLSWLPLFPVSCSTLIIWQPIAVGTPWGSLANRVRFNAS